MANNVLEDQSYILAHKNESLYWLFLNLQHGKCSPNQFMLLTCPLTHCSSLLLPVSSCDKWDLPSSCHSVISFGIDFGLEFEIFSHETGLKERKAWQRWMLITMAAKSFLCVRRGQICIALKAGVVPCKNSHPGEDWRFISPVPCLGQ